MDGWRMGGWLDEWVDKLMDDGWVDGWVGGKMGGLDCSLILFYSPLLLKACLPCLLCLSCTVLSGDTGAVPAGLEHGNVKKGVYISCYSTILEARHCLMPLASHRSRASLQ